MQKRKAIANALWGLMLFGANALALTENCPPPNTCGPCGEFITQLPMPTYDNCASVNPLQNYLATAEDCIRGGWSGFYLGTGFGYGKANYNLKIPTLTFNNPSNNYMVEYLVMGFAHSRNGFFIAAELGYYYDSVTAPIFYEDPSSFVLSATTPGLPPATIIVSPCTVRLDINAQSHVALDLMPGFSLTPYINFFGRLGFEYTGYTWKRQTCFPQAVVMSEDQLLFSVELFNDPIFGPMADITDSQTDGVVDFRLGVGASYMVAPHVTLTLNYVHIFGSKASFTPTASLITPNGPILIDIGMVTPIDTTLTSNISTLLAQNTIDPSRNEVLFGVLFSF